MTIRSRIQLAVSLVVVIATAVFSWYVLERQRAEAMTHLRSTIRETDQLLAIVLARPLYDGDVQQLNIMLDSLFHDTNMTRLVLKEYHGDIRLERERPPVAALGTTLESKMPVMRGGDALGEVDTAYSTAHIEQRLLASRNRLLLFSAALLLGMFVIIWFLAARLVRPIGRLSAMAQAMARGELDRKVEARGPRELVILAESFIVMRDAIRQKITALAKANDDLRKESEERARDITDRKKAEHELRIKDSAVASSISGIAIADLDGRINYVNPAWLQMQGYPTADEVLGTTPLQHVQNPADAAAILEAIKTQGRWTGELMCRRSDGSCFPTEITANLVTDADGKPISLMASFQDVTARKRGQESLQISEERLRQAVRCSEMGIFDHNHRSDTLYWSPEQRIIYGWSPDAPVRLQDYIAMVHPEDLERISQAVRRAHDPAGDGLFDVEHRIVRRNDARIRWVMMRSQTLFEGEGAGCHPVRTIGAQMDVTERKVAEERLRQQAALLEATHDAIIVWEVDGGVQFLNSAAEKLTGWSLALARSHDLPEVLRPRNELSLRAAIKEVDTHGSWSGELSLLAEGDKTRDVDSRWTMVADRQGEPKCILITCNDITEKKLLEAQYLRSQRLESLGTLASGVAHDLNNILSPIIMGVDMLEHAIHDQEHQAILGMMHESAQRGKETIRQLLTFARGAESEKGPVQPRHLLKEVARLVQQTFPKNIQIYTDYTGEPATVMGDPSQLHQVLMNLCINARDAMPEGGVVFLTLENKVLDESSANIHPKARPVPYIVFKVSDSGMGIPPHVLDRIFDPFFTTKPLGKGTGLGLATVLGIVESHGGFVLVESTLGKGTTFQVYLPAGAPAQNGTTAPQEPSPVRRGQGELVLIVDDELPIVRMAEEILRHSGYVTLTASNASEALHLFEKNHDLIRAVLTDIMMPFGDGRQLIMALYEKDPELPIIAMSGLATREFQRETIMRGARAFLSKPFTSDQLLALLADTLKHDTRSTQSTDGASPPPNNPHAN